MFSLLLKKLHKTNLDSETISVQVDQFLQIKKFGYLHEGLHYYKFLILKLVSCLCLLVIFAVILSFFGLIDSVKKEIWFVIFGILAAISLLKSFSETLREIGRRDYLKFLADEYEFYFSSNESLYNVFGLLKKNKNKPVLTISKPIDPYFSISIQEYNFDELDIVLIVEPMGDLLKYGISLISELDNYHNDIQKFKNKFTNKFELVLMEFINNNIADSDNFIRNYDVKTHTIYCDFLLNFDRNLNISQVMLSFFDGGNRIKVFNIKNTIMPNSNLFYSFMQKYWSLFYMDKVRIVFRTGDNIDLDLHNNSISYEIDEYQTINEYLNEERVVENYNSYNYKDNYVNNYINNAIIRLPLYSKHAHEKLYYDEVL